MSPEILGGMIPIVAITGGLGVAFWAIYWGHRQRQLEFEERRLMIEKGLTPPPLLSRNRPATPADHLRRGIIMAFLAIGFGIGYLLVLRVANPDDAPPPWLFGLAAAIIGLLGLGNIVYYAIAKKQPESN